MLSPNVTDRRRVQEIDTSYQRKMRKFSEMPDRNQLGDGEVCRLVNGSGVFLVWREGGDLYQVPATKVG
jgi:hypothetical protein